MLPDEVASILEIAEQFWEKAKPYELGLMCKTCQRYLATCQGGSLGEQGLCPAFVEVEKE